METQAKHGARLALVPMLVLLATGQPASGQTASSDTRVLAEVNGKRLLVADFRKRLAEERKRGVAQNRLETFAAGARAKLLDEMIDIKRLAMAARETGLHERAEITRELENLMDEFLAHAFVADLAARLDLSDRALRGYYESDQDEFQVPGRVRARHVVVKTQAEAVSILGKLRRNDDFARLAREHNIDSTKESGGDLGWIKKGVMVPPFERALFAMKAGEISPVVQTSYGFHIIRVEEIEPSSPKPYDTVVSQIKQRIVETELDALKAQLARKHPAKVQQELLRSIP